MPDSLLDIIRSRTISSLCYIAADLLCKGVVLQTPDGLGEHAGGNKIKNASGEDQEDLDRHAVSPAVEQIPDKAGGEDASDDGDGEGGRRVAQRDTADKDDSLDALTHGGDEWQDEHDISPGPIPKPTLGACLLPLLNKSLGKLDAPLLLHLVYTEQSQAHESNDDGGDEIENALPEVFALGPDILSEAIEDPDEGPSDDEADDNACEGPEPDLADQPLVDLLVLVRLAERFFEEGEKDGNDDNGFETLSEDNEEDLGSKDVWHIGGAEA